ncbi:MAG: ArnT family glycosyltransferase [Chthoniobacterales bacterium]
MKEVRAAKRSFDPLLLAVLVAAAFFCLHGMGWGRVEDWNRDQMALRALDGLRPYSFSKPPFDTYLNHFFVLAPVRAAEWIRERSTGQPQQWNHVRLLGSRLLVMLQVLGTVVLGYVISRRFFGVFAARVTALFLGTSAGFIASAHFLSCDTPLLFFLLLTLYFAQRIMQRGRMRDYVWAGLFAGIATATKYNGLAAGILIPIAHLLSPHCTSLRGCLFHPRVLLGVFLVPIGFVLGNPYAVLDWPRFRADFMYNYEVTPVYGGQQGIGYGAFLRRFGEILGPPGTYALWILVLGGVVIMLHPRLRERARVPGFLLIASFFVLYYLKIGAFPRMPVRLVLPAVPFAILLAGPLLAKLEAHRRLIYVLLAPVIAYNFLCSALVGWRFASDPRLAAQDWMLAHLARGQLVESSPSSPRWAKLDEVTIVEHRVTDADWGRPWQRGRTVDLRMPSVNGRAQLFGRILKGNRWVEAAGRREGEPDENLFSGPALLTRNPDFIAIYEEDTLMPSPTVRAYYAQLRAGRFPYQIGFDQDQPKISPHLYPRKIDFLDGRMTILERRPPLP